MMKLPNYEAYFKIKLRKGVLMVSLMNKINYL